MPHPRLVTGRLVTALLGATVVGLCAGPLALPAMAADNSDTYESDVIKYTNVERAKAELVKVKASSCVDSFAESQARAMAAKKSMYHQPLKPILDKCKLSTVGENVAYGYASGEAVTKAWMNSKGHRANILNPKYRLIGVGAAQADNGQWYVSQVFGRAA